MLSLPTKALQWEGEIDPVFDRGGRGRRGDARDLPGVGPDDLVYAGVLGDVPVSRYFELNLNLKVAKIFRV